MPRPAHLLRLLAALACLLALALAPAAHAQAERRVALVIGNAAYKGIPLRNPVNDAVDVAASLRAYGFTVIERTNLTTRQIGPTLREFRSRLAPGSVAVVYYAGHGLQIKGENYLPAVDAEIGGEEDVPTQSLSTRQLMDVLADAKTRMNLVFLDACRDNPFARSFRSSSRGLSRENAPSGTLISFATRPGSVAADGTGRNGLYTSVLLEQIKQADQPIELVLKGVVSGVKAASRGQQEPWMEGSIEGDFCFGACAQRMAASAPPAAPSEAAIQERFWNEATAVDTVAAYEAYLERYPDGTWARMARAKIQKLASSATAVAAAPALAPSAAPAAPAVSDAPRPQPARISGGASSGVVRFAYVDVASLLRLTGVTSDKANLERLNPKVREFAERFQIHLILQEAVYVHPRANVTQPLHAYLAMRPAAGDFVGSLPSSRDVHVRFVDVNKVLTRSAPAIRARSTLESEFKARERELAGMSNKSGAEYVAKKREFDADLTRRRNEELAKVLEIANRAIKDLSGREGIDLVLQEAVYIAPEFDLTERLLPLLR